MGILSEIVACLACPECKHVGIELLHEKRFGLATKCKMLCGNCIYEKSGPHKKSKRVEHSTSTKGPSLP